MRRIGRTLTAAMVALGALAGLGACGDGEDRPGQVTSEGGGSGSGSASGSGSGSGTGAGHEHGHGDTESQFDEADADSTVEVGMRDYAFEGVPAETKGENVLFRATVTQGAHELQVVGPDGESLGEVEPFASNAGEKKLALKLAPGTYTLQCLVEEGAKTHADLGMKATLTVT